MTRASLGLLVAAALGGLAAWSLGGSLGFGALAGVAAACAVAGIGAVWQRSNARAHPERLMLGSVVTFLVKLVVLLIGALVLRFVEPLSDAVDWRSFLVSFAAAALLVSVLASADVLAEVRSARDTGAR